MAGFHTTLVSPTPETGMGTLSTPNPSDRAVPVSRLLRDPAWCLHLTYSSLLAVSCSTGKGRPLSHE
jgi:hypothetical protein